MTPTESEWKTLAENALSVSESFYLFWHEGFGSDSEVLERYKKLNLAPYKGFVNPKYEVVTDADGTITDVTVTYDEGYAEQMLRYSKDYSTLSSVNK